MCKCKPFTQKSATSFLEVVKGTFKPRMYSQILASQTSCLLPKNTSNVVCLTQVLMRDRQGWYSLVRAITNHQCSQGSNPGINTTIMSLEFVFWFSSCSERFFYKYSDFHLSSSNISNSSLTRHRLFKRWI